MGAFTVHPSSQPEPPDRHVGQMPPGWTPTPPSPEQRAAYLREHRIPRLETEIEMAHKVGNTAREFALTDDLAKLRHKAGQYEKLAQWQAEQPLEEERRPAPRRTTFVIGG